MLMYSEFSMLCIIHVAAAFASSVSSSILSAIPIKAFLPGSFSFHPSIVLLSRVMVAWILPFLTSALMVYELFGSNLLPNRVNDVFRLSSSFPIRKSRDSAF